MFLSRNYHFRTLPICSNQFLPASSLKSTFEKYIYSLLHKQHICLFLQLFEKIAGSIVQRIEQQFPKLQIRVRFPVGLLMQAAKYCKLTTYSTFIFATHNLLKSVFPNPKQRFLLLKKISPSGSKRLRHKALRYLFRFLLPLNFEEGFKTWEMSLSGQEQMGCHN